MGEVRITDASEARKAGDGGFFADDCMQHDILNSALIAESPDCTTVHSLLADACDLHRRGTDDSLPEIMHSTQNHHDQLLCAYCIVAPSWLLTYTARIAEQLLKAKQS